METAPDVRTELARLFDERIEAADEQATQCERDAQTYTERGAAWRRLAEDLRATYARVTGAGAR
jgi:hypothetical protein